MKILLGGATGFVGGHVSRHLEGAGHEVVPISRQAGLGLSWNEAELAEGVRTADAALNLAGENLFDGRWSARRKEELVRSRVETTGLLARLFAEKGSGTLVNASAIGIYGPRDDEPLDESTPPADDFLARLCRRWEEALAPAREAAGVRVAVARIGVVLGEGGGALQKMLLPFKLGVGGPIGSGRQYFSWIHRHDLARLLRFLLETGSAEGVFNATAPEPVTMREFARSLGRVLRRPAFLPTPRLALRIALGEVADVLATGQRVLPKRALLAGFEFEHPEVEGALRSIL